MIRACIYARYSSSSQNEQSIDGQVAACEQYALEHNMDVIERYCDYAKSGLTDERPEFQRMLYDASQARFDVVLLYQFDRFARDKVTNAVYKTKLREEYGIKVVSVLEYISDDASGYIQESFLEVMGQFYSLDLSRKIRRGMNQNAEKHLTLGQNKGFGLMTVEKKIVPDPKTAPIVREIYERYANGDTLANIADDLNRRGIKTGTGGTWNKNSFRGMLSNVRYTGCYTYKGEITPDVIPRIVSDELFQQVQKRVNQNKHSPARAKAKMPYLLTDKLFCGHCKEKMTGEYGNSKTGTRYYYYACSGRKYKRNDCKKKHVRKELIEGLIVNSCKELLTDDNIRIIAKEVAAIIDADYTGSTLHAMEEQLKDLNKSIKNLLKAIETGDPPKELVTRLTERSMQKKALEVAIAKERLKTAKIDEKDILFFLYSLREGAMDEDQRYRKMLVDTFLVRAYVYDDNKVTFILRTSKNDVTVTRDLIETIEQSESPSASLSFNHSASPSERLRTEMF